MCFWPILSIKINHFCVHYFDKFYTVFNISTINCGHFAARYSYIWSIYTDLQTCSFKIAKCVAYMLSAFTHIKWMRSSFNGKRISAPQSTFPPVFTTFDCERLCYIIMLIHHIAFVLTLMRIQIICLIILLIVQLWIWQMFSVYIKTFCKLKFIKAKMYFYKYCKKFQYQHFTVFGISSPWWQNLVSQKSEMFRRGKQQITLASLAWQNLVSTTKKWNVQEGGKTVPLNIIGKLSLSLKMFRITI